MERATIRTRDIQFFSEKNQQMVCVHSRRARDFAKHLEQQSWVSSYETCVPLMLEKFQHISPSDIRKEYFNMDWTTDFVIRTADGRISVREFVDERDLIKKAAMEKLELSRRYWSILEIADWKLVICGKATRKQMEEQYD